MEKAKTQRKKNVTKTPEMVKNPSLLSFRIFFKTSDCDEKLNSICSGVNENCPTIAKLRKISAEEHFNMAAVDQSELGVELEWA